MDTALLIYLYIVIGNLKWLVVIVSTIGAIGSLATLVFGIISKFGTVTGNTSDYSCDRLYGDNLLPEAKWYHALYKATKPFAIASFVLLILSSLYPSKKDLAVIFGGTALVSVASSEEAKKLPDNILKAANAFLEGVYEGGEE